MGSVLKGLAKLIVAVLGHKTPKKTGGGKHLQSYSRKNGKYK